MSDTEHQYAQIEKEALTITWACEKFSPYILGKAITIETDQLQNAGPTAWEQVLRQPFAQSPAIQTAILLL